MYFCMFSKLCNIFHCTCFKQVLSKFICWKSLQNLCLSTVLVAQGGIITEKSFYRYYCYSFFNSPGKTNYLFYSMQIISLLSCFRWSNVQDSLFATTGRPGNHVNIYHMDHHKVSYFCKYQVFKFGMIVIAVSTLA